MIAIVNGVVTDIRKLIKTSIILERGWNGCLVLDFLDMWITCLLDGIYLYWKEADRPPFIMRCRREETHHIPQFFLALWV